VAGDDVTTTLLRATLACLALSAAFPGLLATLSPTSFYDSFPFGRGWVQTLPPYNEHLVHDVGNYKLAFTLLFACAAWRPSRALVVPVASAWAVAALLHAGYHTLNLDGVGTADAIALIALLVTVLALPVVAIVLARREPATARPAPAEGRPAATAPRDFVAHAQE
jgi:hypothetical protein